MFRRTELWHVAAGGLAFVILSTVAIPSVGQSLVLPNGRSEYRAAEILNRLDTARGVCVLLDPQPAPLALELARRGKLMIYLQLPTDKATDAARRRLDAAGLLGTRIYVEKGDWSHLHLADNLADAVVVTPAGCELPGVRREELLRVVNPLGKVLLGNQEISKPYPPGIDDWSHPYHGPDNNPLSSDRLARAPYLTQFLGEPWYAPFPGVTVASGGRLFTAFGHVAFKRREWPWLNSLVATNGYNGIVLWKRPLEPGFMVHRNTMVATPGLLYLGDNTSCKRIDTLTGELRDEITAPPDASGPAWKWMALEDGVLYALVGPREPPDQVLRGTRTGPGWPWKPITKGYDAAEYRWGFGRTFFAVDTNTKQALWAHHEKEPIDGRAVCMKGGRIYYYANQKFLACLDAGKGKPQWRSSEAKLLEAIGPHDPAQTWQRGFSTTSYIKCSEQAVYFAGPQRRRLVAVSAADGRLLWQYPAGNFRLVLRNEGLYALGKTCPSKLFDPLTGRVLAELSCLRGNCTRVTGTIDSVFARGDNHGGTLRLAVADNHPQRIALMRPPCNDGVITAGGLMYWGPWMCDCSLSLVGRICLGSAGDFRFPAGTTDPKPQQLADNAEAPMVPLPVAAGDWPTYRADNSRSAASRVDIPAKVGLAWQHKPPREVDSTAPITAGGLVFVGGSDGVVRALDAADGKLRWEGYTGGRIYYPPAVEQGRLLVGSGDGWVYAFQAATGKLLWRFPAAPAERKINLYGRLSSTWPVAGGVLVDDGVAYAAAGIASYDGTHVYALDAATGKVRWHNDTSGRLAGKGTFTGVSVQGHLLLHRDRLYLAGGNVVSPAVYDLTDGRCLNRLDNEWTKAPRGCELFLVDGKVVAFDRLLYAPKQYWRGRYFAGALLQAGSGKLVVRGEGGRIVRIDTDSAGGKPKSLWQSRPLQRAVALALGNNAVVVAGRLPSSPGGSPPRSALAALAVDDGHMLWSHPLPAMPNSWGLALDDAGRIVVALQDGRVLCFTARK